MSVLASKNEVVELVDGRFGEERIAQPCGAVFPAKLDTKTVFGLAVRAARAVAVDPNPAIDLGAPAAVGVDKFERYLPLPLAAIVLRVGVDARFHAVEVIGIEDERECPDAAETVDDCFGVGGVVDHSRIHGVIRRARPPSLGSVFRLSGLPEDFVEKQIGLGVGICGFQPVLESLGPKRGGSRKGDRLLVKRSVRSAEKRAEVRLGAIRGVVDLGALGRGGDLEFEGLFKIAAVDAELGVGDFRRFGCFLGSGRRSGKPHPHEEGRGDGDRSQDRPPAWLGDDGAVPRLKEGLKG